MSKQYKADEVVGNFVILAKKGSSTGTNGSRQGVYSVRCRSCGKVTVLTAGEARVRKDCGCSRIATQEQRRKRRAFARREREVWMDEGEIYRSWKSMKDKDLGYSILAELNDVPVRKIIEIIHRQEGQIDGQAD